LLAVEFVLADGSIVTASSTENSDLFWAARGAGQAFGVATNFVFQAYEQKNAVWGGMVVFPPTQLKEIFEASNQLVDACTGKSQHGIAFFAPAPDFHPCLAAVVFYNGSEEEGKKFFEPLYGLKPVADMTSVMPYDKVNEMLVRIAFLIIHLN
jgi:FAD/FMN-containing dehydrogenase